MKVWVKRRSGTTVEGCCPFVSVYARPGRQPPESGARGPFPLEHESVWSSASSGIGRMNMRISDNESAVRLSLI